MSSTRKHYQSGCLIRVHHSGGPDTWSYRWRELRPDGSRVHRSETIGDTSRYPTKADATLAVGGRRTEINTVDQKIGRMTVKEAWAHFQTRELRDPDVNRSPSTIQ